VQAQPIVILLVSPLALMLVGSNKDKGEPAGIRLFSSIITSFCQKKPIADAIVSKRGSDSVFSINNGLVSGLG